VRASAALVIGALLAGAAVRFFGGLPLVATDLAFDSPSTVLPPADGSPEAAASSFYAFLQQGSYDAAWEMSMEPAWPGAGTASYGTAVTAEGRPAGWTGKAEFVRRCRDELGQGPKLNGVRAVRLHSPPVIPGQGAVAALMASRIHGVHLSGHMLGACLIYSWEKDLAVVEVGREYRVLLPGTKDARASFHEAWFSDMTLIGSLRAAGSTAER
jgi:hypothetical protein